jgi:hypothetical protein
LTDSYRKLHRESRTLLWVQIYNGLGERDETLVWLERGFEQRDPLTVFLKVDTRWNNLRSDRTSMIC